MKDISDETYHLLQQLYQPPSLITKILVRQDKIIQLLEKIGESGEPLVIPNLLSFVVTRHDETALVAARIIDNLINHLSISDLANLDDQIRQVSFYYPNIWHWTKINPDDIGDLGRLQNFQVSVLGISSFHNNGYIRERAIGELGKIWTGKELPYLLIRLNDWVSNVRESATKAITPRLTSSYALFFVDCLPLLMRLGKRKRIVQSSIANSVQELLQTESSRPALLHGFESQNRFVRRACYQIALHPTAIPQLDIIERGIKDGDNLIRLWCVQKMRALSANAETAQLLRILLQDAYMPVRKEALRIIVEKYPDRASEELDRALLDSHRSMRYEARYYINKTRKMDFAAFYRGCLAQKNGVYAAICGLEETGNETDDRRIEPYTQHPLAKVRCAAIKALAKLHPKAHTDLFLQCVLDPLPSVSREAAGALARSSHRLNGERLWKDFNEVAILHIKENILLLFAHLPKWESIYYLLRAAASKEASVSEMAYQRINVWRSHYNSSFITPTVLQKTNLLRLLEENENHIDIRIRGELVSILERM